MTTENLPIKGPWNFSRKLLFRCVEKLCCILHAVILILMLCFHFSFCFQREGNEIILFRSCAGYWELSNAELLLSRTPQCYNLIKHWAPFWKVTVTALWKKCFFGRAHFFGRAGLQYSRQQIHIFLFYQELTTISRYVILLVLCKIGSH